MPCWIHEQRILFTSYHSLNRYIPFFTHKQFSFSFLQGMTRRTGEEEGGWGLYADFLFFLLFFCDKTFVFTRGDLGGMF